MSVHSRFVFTPTGPAHVGHAYLARINRRLAESTGGTFAYRFEDTLAYQSGRAYRENRLLVSDQNLKDMIALGLGPSDGKAFRANGIPPAAAIKYQSASTITNWYWHLFGFDRIWGEWPAPMLESANVNGAALYIGTYGGRFTLPASHPYVVLNRVADDLATGRNLIVRGHDLSSENGLYQMFAEMILGKWREVPRMCYLPWLGFQDAKGAVRYPSSSDSHLHPDLLISAVLEAGRTGEELFAFLDPYTWQDFQPGQDVIADGIDNVVARMKSEVIVPENDWARFLKGGG